MSRFHQELSADLSTLHLTRGRKLNYLAPRGSAKSTWSTQAYPLYAALEGLEKFIIITADSFPQSVKYTDAIRNEVEGNVQLQKDYGGIVEGADCKAGSIMLGNGCLIEAASTGGRIRGRKNDQHRPGLIIGDDLQSIDHVTSDIMRARSWDWFTRDAMNAGDENTNFIVLGTSLHRDCISCKLQATAGWESRVYKSIEQWPANMQLWQEWADRLHNWDDPERDKTALAFFEANREAMEA